MSVIEIALAITLVGAGFAYGVLLSKYERLKKQVTWVESSQDQIENFLDIQRDLQNFGKATVEIKRLDQAGIFYREPIK